YLHLYVSPFSFSSLFHSSSPSSSSSSISKIDQDKKKTSTVTTIVKYTGNSPLLRGVHVGSSSSSLSEEGEQGEEEERLSSSSKVGRKKESSGALSLSSSSSSLHSPYDPTCSSPSSSSYPCSFLLIADLDGNSRVESPFLSSSDLLFKSYILKAKLYVHPTSRVSPSSHSPQSSPSPSFFLSSDYHIEFEEIKETDGYRQEDQEKQEKDTSSSPPPVYHQILYGKHNEGGRGLELSELIYFNRELLTFDDRTGIVYKLSLQTKKLIAKYLLVEGDGVSSSKGMKIEWATVKDDLLYVGSFGKEFTDSSGEIVHYHNVWIAVIDRQGQITRQDWAEPYRRIRE
ncbi:apyrase, partial [Cystoisospora suis]